MPIEDTLQARAKPRLLHLIAAAGMAAVCFWFAYHAMSVSADEFRAETLDNPRGAIFADVPAPIVAGVAALFGALCIWLFVRSLMQRIKKPIIFEADEKGVRSHLNGRARELAWSQIEQVIQVRGVVMLYGRDASETRVTVSLLPKQLDVPSSAFWNLLRERRPDLVK